MEKFFEKKYYSILIIFYACILDNLSKAVILSEAYISAAVKTIAFLDKTPNTDENLREYFLSFTPVGLKNSSASELEVKSGNRY